MPRASATPRSPRRSVGRCPTGCSCTSTSSTTRGRSAHEPGERFELAGPRDRLFFDPARTRAGIVTCGGLCPGLNDVIRSVFLELHYGYGVGEVLGFRGGYQGLDPAAGLDPLVLTPAFVETIHQQGGTVLGTSRGPVDIGRAVDALIDRQVHILFTIGGDGTQRGGSALFAEATRRGHPLAVVGIPKTVDNDVAFVTRSFGFLTAVEEAAMVLDRAHTEARSVRPCVALVKLMGRHAGFIAAGATVASQDVNVTLIPEVPFALDGPGGLLAALERRVRDRGHALVVVAEGAGQDLLAAEGTARDASGNVKLQDIGVVPARPVRGALRGGRHPAGAALHRSELPRAEQPGERGGLDPLRPVRAPRGPCRDGRHAPGIVIGLLHDQYVHVPIDLLTSRTKRVDPDGHVWRAVLAATGQPERFA